jgi:hypothetical protein
MKVMREEVGALPPSRGVIMGCIGVGVCGRGDDMALSVESGLLFCGSSIHSLGV